MVLLQVLPRLLDEVHLGTGHGRGGDEAAVFGADQGQVALSRVGAILRGLELPLESTDSGDALLRHALLFLQLSLVDGDLLVGLVEALLQQGDVLRVLLHLDHHLLDVAFLLAQDLHGLGMSALLFVQLELQVANLRRELQANEFFKLTHPLNVFHVSRKFCDKQTSIIISVSEIDSSIHIVYI